MGSIWDGRGTIGMGGEYKTKYDVRSDEYMFRYQYDSIPGAISM